MRKFKPLKNITIMRINKGIKQKELAEKIGVKANTLCSYEKGNISPTFEMLQKIAQELQCDIKDII